MEYSVEKLAELSGVSVRTLHYYDEIGLLIPLMRVGNGRRIYGMEEMLRLQEILYFKEIGLSLKKIQAIIDSKNLSKVEVLSSQKQLIIKEVDRYKKLLKSVDITINHYKGLKMTNKQIVDNFENFKKKADAAKKYVEERVSKELMESTINTLTSMSEEDRLVYVAKTKQNLFAMMEAMNKGLAHDSVEVQRLTKDTFNLYLKEPTKEEYLRSRDFIKDKNANLFMFEMNSELPEYIFQAMGVFAERNFS